MTDDRVTTEEIEEGMALLRGPDIEVEPPQSVLQYRGRRAKIENRPAWVKFSTSFRNGMVKKLKGAPLSVFIIIALHIDDNRECWPSAETICDETGWGRTTVVSAIKRLQKMGLIATYQRHGLSNIYTVLAGVAFGEGAPVPLRNLNTTPPESEHHPSAPATTTPPLASGHEVEPVKKSQEDIARKPARVHRPELSALEDLFCELTGISKESPKSEKDRRRVGERWWQPLRRLHQAADGSSGQVLREAVRRMKKDGLTISAPASVENTWKHVLGEHNLKARKEVAAAPADDFAGLIEYVERRDNGRDTQHDG